MTTTTKTRPSKAKAPATKAAAKPRTTKPKAEPTPPPAPATDGYIEMSATMLKQIIAVVAPAAANDEGRPVLCNISVELTADGRAVFAATDSYRLHHLVLNVALDVGRQEGHVTGQIPAWWLQRWARGKFTKGDVVRLSWTETTATISCGDMTDSMAHDRFAPFPNMAKIMDDAAADPTQSIAHFNPRFLSAVLAACAKWGSGEYSPVRLDPLAPGMFVAKSADGLFTGLLMPVRVG